MQITFKGDLGFVLDSTNVSVALCLDPQQISQESVIITAKAEDQVKVTKDQFVFDWPGEYEGSGASVMIIPTGKTQQNRVIKILVEDLAIAHLGDLTEPLTDSEKEKIGNIDILFVSANKSAVTKDLQATIEDIDPRLVIPMNFQGVEATEFAKHLGHEEVEPVNTLKIKRSGLPNDRMDLQILNAQ